MSLSNAKRQPQSPDSRCCHAKIKAVEICGVLVENLDQASSYWPAMVHATSSVLLRKRPGMARLHCNKNYTKIYKNS